MLLIEVSSWETLLAEIKNEIQIHAFWPVFSPDSQYLALEEVDWEDGSNPSNQRLVAFNLGTLEKTTLYDLTEYAQDAMYVTDWVK
jgi:hypothetical protein